jgi:hypothetical protein
MSKRIAKPHDIRWPGKDGLPRSFEDINANFDALFKALEGAGISPSGVISPPGPTGGGGTGTPPGLSDPVTESHGGTGKTTYSKGDLLVGKADHKLDALAVGAAGTVLTATAGTAAWVDPAHAVLSARHTDTTAAAVVRGDIITGQGATPLWKRLAKGALGYVLKMGADEPAWTDPAHAVLSADHSDATAAAVVRGDLIVGQGASAKWARLGKGALGYVLTMGADEPAWTSPLPTVRVVTATTTELTTDGVIVCNKTTAMTVTLLAATGSGRTRTIKNINTGTVTIDGDSGDTIDGDTTMALGQWDSVTLVDYAANKWVVI